MKPPFRISQIKWLPYPDNKPETREIIAADNDGNSCSAYWIDGKMDCYGMYEKDIIYFAELPTVDDSDEFGFATALELMLNKGVACECATWGNTEFCEKWKYIMGDFAIYSERNNGYELATPDGNAFGVQHIRGKWRLA